LCKIIKDFLEKILCIPEIEVFKYAGNDTKIKEKWKLDLFISELIDIMLRSCFSSILVRSLSPSNLTGLSIIFYYTVLF
jgi:hypothetical protein